MKLFNLTYIIILMLISFTAAYAQENQEKPNSNVPETVKLPVNVYDTFTFNETVSPYMRKLTYFSPPIFMCLYGVYMWNWEIKEKPEFHLKPEHFWGAHDVNGGADKYGHMFSNYVGTRLFTFMLRATGSSKNMAIIQGALLDDAVGLIGEIGDGYSPNYGFDPYDVLFNQFGILLGMLLEYFPSLDRIFTMSWEYFPSKRVRNHANDLSYWDLSTDYSDQKYLLTTKLGGIPYVSLTPLRYINIDLGFYTRGYRNAGAYQSRTRNIFLGISINYTIAFGDLLPVGYASSTLQTIFNYYHPPCDLEVHKWVLSDRPHSEFKAEE